MSKPIHCREDTGLPGLRPKKNNQTNSSTIDDPQSVRWVKLFYDAT